MSVTFVGAKQELVRSGNSKTEKEVVSNYTTGRQLEERGFFFPSSVDEEGQAPCEEMPPLRSVRIQSLYSRAEQERGTSRVSHSIFIITRSGILFSSFRGVCFAQFAVEAFPLFSISLAVCMSVDSRGGETLQNPYFIEFGGSSGLRFTRDHDSVSCAAHPGWSASASHK